MGLREIRFGVSTGGAASRADWQQRARRVEALGYDILLTADHLVDDAFPPLLPLVSAADVTERLRVGTYVVNNDLRHPVLLAREAAALGVLTDGRFLLGLGAGHMKFEYDEAGIPFDDGRVRVDRLEESVEVILGLLDGEEVTHAGAHYTVTGHRAWPRPPDAPRVPLLIGGNGRRVLALAAQRADAVGFAGFSHNRDATEVRLNNFTAEGLDAQVAWVREHAGDRLDDLELTALVQIAQVTDDRRAAATAIAERMEQLTVDQVLDSPYLLLGTVAQIVEQVRAARDRWGVTSWISFAERPRSDQTLETLAPVIEALG
jgi:probable F420-dependent oxidoreductase